MKRTLIIALVALALVALVAATGYVLLGRGMPDNARAQLDQYLAYRYPLSPAPAIGSAVQAIRPWFFKADDSGASYGDTVYYGPTVHIGRQAAPIRFPSTTPADLATYYGGQRPLPYPPQDVWCVRLDVAEPGSAIIVVALHQDLYGADWIVHELPGTWSDADRTAALSEWGCGF
jgi:hypothetical protein